MEIMDLIKKIGNEIRINIFRFIEKVKSERNPAWPKSKSLVGHPLAGSDRLARLLHESVRRD